MALSSSPHTRELRRDAGIHFLPGRDDTAAERSGVLEPFRREKVIEGVRKAVRGRPVTDAEETQIALAWRADSRSDLLASRIEEFIGIVRGRTARSSRSPAVDDATPASADRRPGAAKPGSKSGSRTASQSKRATPARDASFAQQRKNAAARKKHRGR